MKIAVKLFLIIYIITNQSLLSQDNNKPKLVVGIVIDQMRAEYLYRFQENYSENGFKKLMTDGFHVKNVHYNYTPTSTGPGHASIYTGTTPSNHGVIGNNWLDRKSGKEMYCSEDNTVYKIDMDNADINATAYARSPKKLLVTTITDELKLFTNKRSKVIGVSIKDRGAILPAGHLADYAFWYNSKNGNFITSSYYSKKLPKWLETFNNNKVADSLLNSVWNTLLPIDKYVNSSADNASFEKIFNGKEDAAFPYDLKRLRKQNNDYGLISEIPFGNTLVTKMAKAALIGERLGKGKETDFLAISYSSTDYVGHNFGIRSKELEDTYVRMDREIESLLTTLDKEIGKENYILFITADHAARDNPIYLENMRLPGAFYSPLDIKKSLNEHLSQEFGGTNYVEYVGKSQIYINKTLSNREKVLKSAKSFLMKQEVVKEVCIPSLSTSLCNSFMENGYHSKRSGDLLISYNFGWMTDMKFGTTHGSSSNNDTHVPLLWYGHNISKGETIKPYSITQIVPTLSFLLNIPLPNASNNVPIFELFK
ncbi:alkaline phosphatase PafA [Flavivirga spongiicola]|uniref:Alkaline phosphatase family protein n=1 Tax=Flavivirga spongiicola TaxID=421621 RepID=A0ABU7XPI4_9FLAO|nr:alkaline phosphatase PafA [Flavivirga sp. MEBiC05379]MDO5977353.1 alkaline phosphatase family protein [Flavivirga sp. MEBiC05379]